MIDIETFGNGSNSVIASIAAVEFDLSTGVTGQTFYEKISIQSCLDIGLKIDGSTLAWWMAQSEPARKEVVSGTKSIKQVLNSLTLFFSLFDLKTLQVWGNGSRFDLGLLEDAYRAVGYDVPWRYPNERDVRTLVSFKPEIKKYWVFAGDQHNALDDCHHQIAYCHATYKAIRYEAK